ncbi:MAG: Crp/Fnr family transcriptional regulator [Pseudobdellovibrio sp.]
MNKFSNEQFLSSGFLQKLDFFSDLPTEMLNQLLIGNELVTTTSKQNLFNQEDSADYFGFVVKGIYSLSKINALDQRVVMDFVSPGGMIAGLIMASDTSLYPVTVQSIGSGQFLKIPKTTYRKYWMNNGQVMQKVQIANLERVQALQSVRETQRFSLEQKIAWVLLKLFSNFADKNNRLTINFSRRDIADAAGVSTESIIRTFSQWSIDGIIQKNDNIESVDLLQLQSKII